MAAAAPANSAAVPPPQQQAGQQAPAAYPGNEIRQPAAYGADDQKYAADDDGYGDGGYGYDDGYDYDDYGYDDGYGGAWDANQQQQVVAPAPVVEVKVEPTKTPEEIAEEEAEARAKERLKLESKALHQFEIKFPEEYEEKKKPCSKVMAWLEDCKNDEKHDRIEVEVHHSL